MHYVTHVEMGVGFPLKAEPLAARQSNSVQSGNSLHIRVGHAEGRTERLLEQAKLLKNGKRYTMWVNGEPIGTNW